MVQISSNNIDFSIAGFGNTFTAFGVLSFGLILCMLVLVTECLAKILKIDIYEPSEEEIEVNKEDEIVKNLRAELRQKDIQLESMKVRLKALRKIKNITMNPCSLWSNIRRESEYKV